MCGICGYVNFSEEPINRPIIERMTNSIRHRGPDDNGVYVNGHLGLGHTRLSIIDLSSAGHQPMRSNDGLGVITFNGEVYNFQELRSELESEGMKFHSRTDTEVVLNAYIRWGKASLKMLNGMFAFAIWDARMSEVHLVRDRFGIKPLYYYVLPDGVVFGSEIKAILNSRIVPRKVSLRGLNEYMWFGNALGENTMFDGIYKLPPGHCLTIGRRHIKLECFWQIEDVKPIRPNVYQAKAEVRRLLEDGVRSQLVSDVPVGVFLSGGIDSSAITAFASKHYQSRLQTFTAGFDFDKGNNELAKARLVANRFNTDHHEIRIVGNDVRGTIEALVRCHDEPFADAANIPLFLLCEKLKGSVKVILQGDGGDEMFAGYRRYYVLSHEILWRIVASMSLKLGGAFTKNAEYYRKVRFLSALAQSDPAIRMALLLTVETVQDAPTRILSLEKRNQLAEYNPFQRYSVLNRRFSSFDSVQKMLFTDVSELLSNTFLEKVDKSTMAHGIEIRVPFLDNNLSSYAMSLPSKLKVRCTQKKWILREALRGVLPDVILDGPKTGFSVPYEYWLRGPLSDYLKEVLLDHQTCAAGFFDLDFLEQCINEHMTGARNYGFLLWKSLHLVLWHKEYFA